MLRFSTRNRLHTALYRASCSWNYCHLPRSTLPQDGKGCVQDISAPVIHRGSVSYFHNSSAFSSSKQNEEEEQRDGQKGQDKTSSDSDKRQEESNEKGTSGDSGGSGSGKLFSRVNQWFERVKNENPDLKESVEELKQTEFVDEKTKKATEEMKERVHGAKESWKSTTEGLKDHTGKFHETFEKSTKAGQETAQKAQEKASTTWEKLNERLGRDSKSGDEGAKEETKTEAKKKKESKATRFKESFQDVMAGVFGYAPKRSTENEAEEKYPWVEYQDPESGKVLYRNQNTGVVFEEKPFDFDEKATEANKAQMNQEQQALTIVPESKSRWQQYSERLMQQPIMRQLREYADEIADSEIGEKYRETREEINERKERIKEKWETSQHPLVYNATYAYDRLFSESEQGRAMNELLRIDPGFDEVAFIDEMSRTVIPDAVSAFLRGDRKTLSELATDEAMMHINSVFKARESEGVVQDPTILAINRVEKVTARYETGKPPIMVVSAMVQQINCMRNKKGEVVEGKEDEIRAAVYLFAFQRDYSRKTGELEWRIAEMSMQGSILYL